MPTPALLLSGVLRSVNHTCFSTRLLMGPRQPRACGLCRRSTWQGAGLGTAGTKQELLDNGSAVPRFFLLRPTWAPLRPATSHEHWAPRPSSFQTAKCRHTPVSLGAPSLLMARGCANLPSRHRTRWSTRSSHRSPFYWDVCILRLRKAPWNSPTRDSRPLLDMVCSHTPVSWFILHDIHWADETH